MIAILGIAYGRHGKDYLGEGIATAQDIYSLEQTVATLTDSQLLLLKKSLRALLAVIHNLTRGFLAIDMIGAKRDDSHIHRLAVSLHGM